MEKIYPFNWQDNWLPNIEIKKLQDRIHNLKVILWIMSVTTGMSVYLLLNNLFNNLK